MKDSYDAVFIPIQRKQPYLRKLPKYVQYPNGGPLIGPPAHRANPVIGPGKGLHQVSAIKRELWEI
jgi:hypothetical protein